MTPERVDALGFLTFGELMEGPSSSIEVKPVTISSTKRWHSFCAHPVVKRIQKGNFVDMAELLKDDMKVERCYAAQV